jgi:predicted  nucleic acid-binding Zn-ribbon protein
MQEVAELEARIEQLENENRELRKRVEQLEAALRDYLMFLRKSVNVGPLTKNPSKEAAHLRRLIALIPDVVALAPETKE